MARARATTGRVRLDSRGLDAVLHSAPVRAAVNELAHAVANDVDAALPADLEADTVVVDDYTTDRAAASVTIRDRRGRIWEARDGVLTRAAGAAGLEVRTR